MNHSTFLRGQLTIVHTWMEITQTVASIHRNVRFRLNFLLKIIKKKAWNSHLSEWKFVLSRDICILGNSRPDYHFLCQFLTWYSKLKDSRCNDLTPLGEGFLNGPLPWVLRRRAKDSRCDRYTLSSFATTPTAPNLPASEGWQSFCLTTHCHTAWMWRPLFFWHVTPYCLQEICRFKE